MDDTLSLSSASSHAQPLAHGGDTTAAEARFGPPPNGAVWLDLSTGINPAGYPLAFAAMAPEIAQRLPSRAQLDGLLDAARGAYGLTPGAAIVAAPGTQALIQALPRLFAPSTVGVMSPTYGEHARAWAAAGHRVETPSNICGLAAGPWPHSVVVNPNNPDGREQAVDGVLAFADELHQRGGILVVDEAFADTQPELSVAAHAGQAGHEGLVVLRSVGKFYGLAGVRLGFAIGDAALLERLEAALGPWAVSGPAIWAGTQALTDHDWATATRERLQADARRLDAMLVAAGMDVLGGTALFRLVRHEAAASVYERLGRAGILVRPFEEFPDRLRVGLPGDEGEWARLAAALAR